MSDDTVEGDGRITCATYTHARRHPMVLGKIGDWTPPVQVTLPQVAVLLLAMAVEVTTWRWWGEYLPSMLGILVFLGVPCILAWAVRHTRVEGRSLLRAGGGWLQYLGRPRAGWAGGSKYRPTPSARLHHWVIYVEAGESPK